MNGNSKARPTAAFASRCSTFVVLWVAVPAIVLFTATSRAQQQQCVANEDCQDYNACTTDTCDRGACVHTATNAGGACGLGLNDDCTDPDTCDGEGHCLPNNAPDGTGCNRQGFGGGFCTAGLCVPTRYTPIRLPEDGNLGSMPSDGSLFGGDPDRPVIVGHVFNTSGIAKAAAWHSDDGGQSFNLVLLPTPAAEPSEANAVGCNAAGTCVAVGATGDPELAAAWVFNGSNWNSEAIPLPTGASKAKYLGFRPGVRLFLGDGSSDVAVGWIIDAAGDRKAVLAERDVMGVWTEPVTLPDGGAGTDSEALGLAAAPDPGDDQPEKLVLGGGGKPAGGDPAPAVWVETEAGNGVFTLHTLPLPTGGKSGKVKRTYRRVLLQQGRVVVSVDMTLYDGSQRGAIYRTSDLDTWESVVLRPLPGFSNGETTSAAYLPYLGDVVLEISASSHNTDPLTDGMGTRWTIDPISFVLTSGPTDVDPLITGLAADEIVANITATSAGQTTLHGTRMAVIRKIGGANAAGPGGPPMPHGVFLVAQPQAPIPCVSAWGLAMLALALAIAASMILTSRDHERQRCGAEFG